jgi:hypothetical protein
LECSLCAPSVPASSPKLLLHRLEKQPAHAGHGGEARQTIIRVAGLLQRRVRPAYSACPLVAPCCTFAFGRGRLRPIAAPDIRSGQLGVSTVILDLRSFARRLRSGTVLGKRLPDRFDSGTDFLSCMPQGYKIILKRTERCGSGSRPFTRGLIPVEPDTEGIKDSDFEPLSLSILGRSFKINAHVVHRLATLRAREWPAGRDPGREIVARPAPLESLAALETGEVLLVPAGLVFPTHVALSCKPNDVAHPPGSPARCHAFDKPR